MICLKSSDGSLSCVEIIQNSDARVSVRVPERAPVKLVLSEFHTNLTNLICLKSSDGSASCVGIIQNPTPTLESKCVRESAHV